jgi:hypothetical protein
MPSLRRSLPGRAMPPTEPSLFARNHNRPMTKPEGAAVTRIVAHAIHVALYVTHVPRFSP